ncbi:hypothetical protein [Nocardioides sp. CFH 31398]|uniref:hypothetical protein n=1 Tax=Nocardioides sp. CFH 31398 TaxID=2919579 RepID=UPI001F06CB3F|nr:hypothetical protein [Nocardioides sp. CFH 31398]MCH1865740.1 hypothetical protein [Nocardioides sp. CFH 31398]
MTALITLLGSHRFSLRRETRDRLRLEAASFVSGCEQLFAASTRQQKALFFHAKAEREDPEKAPGVLAILNRADDEAARANKQARASRFLLQLVQPRLADASDELYDAAMFGTPAGSPEGATTAHADRFEGARAELVRQLKELLR